MAIIAMPASGIRTVQWTPPRRAAFAVVSGWTGSQSVGDLGGILSGFAASVEIVPMREDDLRLWRAWRAKMKGPVNSFLLSPVETEQLLLPSPTVLVAGAGQTGATLACDTAPANVLVVREGHVVSINGRGFVVTADAYSNNSGVVSLALDPAIVTAFADNAVVKIQRPEIEMRLSGGEDGWSASPGRIYQPFGFECIEVLA